jgi:hypothetical protein
MCNCKKGGRPKTLNNLKSVDHLNIAKEVDDRILKQKSIEELNDYDWLELYGVFSQLYPNTTGQPSKEEVVNEIKNAVALMGIKYTIKKRR